ncbi:hypothetical protein [Thermococcus sp. Bubb.Bath]|uniref:hypothetical protein n=1 Tax=Thermococcus sp. Bubb.Bath TaxID=1638242 RepID=UPI001438DC23|nr:hypothetical protein [Thermococcus sp. Bubb.Bath]NJF24253.1 hypothetical protein [Thermococcus sp. Bubb.Bath]
MGTIKIFRDFGVVNIKRNEKNGSEPPARQKTNKYQDEPQDVPGYILRIYTWDRYLALGLFGLAFIKQYLGLYQGLFQREETNQI